MIKKITTLFLCLFLLNSCSVMKKTAKKELIDDYYTQKTNKEKQQVYADIIDDTVRIYATKQIKNVLKVDTTQTPKVFLPLQNNKDNLGFLLSKTSLDIDFLTIPLKYRFSKKNVQPQLNTNLNGALYLGYRTDRYFITYKSNPLQKSERKTTHIGYSVGIFSGFGNTLMSPTNTNDKLLQEYDGLIWSKGIAAIFGVNSFTVGLSIGYDNLMDRNKNIWIYENEPWLGLAFGLNLN